MANEIRVLYITEKASVGRALAGVLGKNIKEGDHIRCGDDAIVAWASGHLLELFEPQDYDEKYGSWALETLPIIPEKWKLKEIPRTKGLLNGIKKLLKEADEVVNAGDSDREGQLLIDEILEYCGWKGPTKRLRINDVNPDAIKKALKEMKDNANYIGEYKAGQARSYADWLTGMNLTRYCTVSAGKSGYEAVFSVGRVQTPTLGLVVHRDREIDNFVSKPYYALFATLQIPSGDRQITGRWQPGESAVLDSEKRLVSLEFCNELEEKLKDASGKITNVDKKIHKKAPPLPYSLAKLQMDASKKHDITDTLTYVQKLYENGYVTYPRSGCQYIPEGHHAGAHLVMDAIEVACPAVRDMPGVDIARKSPAWDDSRITEHHAIIPTVKVPLPGALSDTERKVYELICIRYALQFLPEYEYKQTTVEFEAADERFKASGREILVPGWTGWEEDEEETKKKESLDGEEETGKTEFPTVVVGETGKASPVVKEKRTTPPKRFTYDTLLGAMNGIHAYVEDKEIRKQLKELDGIGTSATQENIVKLLFDRNFIEKKKKQILSTLTGQALVDLLSSGKGAMLAKPDLTALWEQKMTRIEKGELELDAFLEEVSSMVGEIVNEPLTVPDIPGIPKKKQCLKTGCDGYLRHLKGTTGMFFACPACKSTFSDSKGEPVARKEAFGEVVETDCPLGCGQKARQFKGQYGLFWKCFCSPDVTFKDEDGKPVVKEPRPKAKCPVKGCKGTAEQIPKKDGGLFWKCKTCQNFFDDASGKPQLREKNPEVTAAREKQHKR